MAQANPASDPEPTMEEILASIRRIISAEHTEDARQSEMAEQGAAAEANKTTETAPSGPSAEVMVAASETLPDMSVPASSIGPEEMVEPEITPLAIEDTTGVDFEPTEMPEDVAALPPEPVAEETPLMLTDVLEETAPGFDEPAAEFESAQQDVPEAIPFTPEPIPEPVTAEQPLVPAIQQAVESELMSAETNANVLSQFKVLENHLAREQTSLADLTSDLLKPMLKAWLDDNLPQMVERLVREEIQRVARGE